MYIGRGASEKLVHLITSRSETYLKELAALGTRVGIENYDGKGACSIVSLGLDRALKDFGIESHLISGYYRDKRGLQTPHAWVGVTQDSEVSVDLTYRQVKGTYMILVIPTHMEESFGLDSWGAISSPHLRNVPVEWYRIFKP